jgi:hypothetical protein
LYAAQGEVRATKQHNSPRIISPSYGRKIIL